MRIKPTRSAVGTPIARRPPRRSQRAALLHWAPALGRRAEAMGPIRMHVLRYLPYASPPTVHTFPALRPVRVLLVRIPLGPSPSLHSLREWFSAVLRRFRRPLPSPAFPPSCPFRFAMATFSSFSRRCSGTSSVLWGGQTPCSVHRWLESSDFPSRSSLPRLPISFALPPLTAPINCGSLSRRTRWERTGRHSLPAAREEARSFRPPLPPRRGRELLEREPR